MRRACFLLAADAQAGVKRNDPFVVGKQRIDVELDQLRQVGQHLRQRDHHVADGVQLRRRMITVAGQQLRDARVGDDVRGNPILTTSGCGVKLGQFCIGTKN